MARYLGWRPPTSLELEELDEFLLARALERDSPLLLFRLALAPNATFLTLMIEVSPQADTA